MKSWEYESIISKRKEVKFVVYKYKKEIIKNIAKKHKKANYYVNKDTTGMSELDLYDFYIIGNIYRDEYGNEWGICRNKQNPWHESKKMVKSLM